MFERSWKSSASKLAKKNGRRDLLDPCQSALHYEGSSAAPHVREGERHNVVLAISEPGMRSYRSAEAHRTMRTRTSMGLGPRHQAANPISCFRFLCFVAHGHVSAGETRIVTLRCWAESSHFGVALRPRGTLSGCLKAILRLLQIGPEPLQPASIVGIHRYIFSLDTSTRLIPYRAKTFKKSSESTRYALVERSLGIEGGRESQ